LGGFVAISQKWVAAAGDLRELVARLAVRGARLSAAGITITPDLIAPFLQLPAKNAILNRTKYI
jgi:hypothetical protein